MAWCTGAAGVAVLGSAGLVVGAHALLPSLADAAPPVVGDADLSFIGIVGMLAFSPLVETALMGWLLRTRIMRKAPAALAVLGTALLWGLLHEALVRGWFFGTVWGFAVFAGTWLLWNRHSSRAAYWSATCVHSINNAVVLGVIALAGDA